MARLDLAALGKVALRNGYAKKERRDAYKEYSDTRYHKRLEEATSSHAIKTEKISSSDDDEEENEERDEPAKGDTDEVGDTNDARIEGIPKRKILRKVRDVLANGPRSLWELNRALLIGLSFRVAGQLEITSVSDIHCIPSFL